MAIVTAQALDAMGAGARIVNTASIWGRVGEPLFGAYVASKHAVIGLTKTWAKELGPRGIRVNAVAPGPIWTPLIPATFPPDKVESFGKNVPMGRPGQPEEVAPSYVFLASEDASYMTGQVLHPNGGEIVNT
jgi:NAD(P)-dependent dehydrogenase (short-subunit alcohol dehydrogenase family)